MYKRIGIFLLSFIFPLVAFAQLAPQEVSNLGFKMGFGFYSFQPGELVNARPMLGYTAGFNVHSDFTKKKSLHLQAGLDFTLRGGNFSNPEDIDSAVNRAYGKITLVTVDFPLSVLLPLKPAKKAESPMIKMGVTPSILLRSVVYVGPDRIPLNSQIYQQSWENLPLKQVEVLAHVGYQKKVAEVGYYLGLNFGMNNLNSGDFKIDGIYPATGSGKRISTWSIEAVMIF
jgi:hypothetical protein